MNTHSSSAPGNLKKKFNEIRAAQIRPTARRKIEIEDSVFVARLLDPSKVTKLGIFNPPLLRSFPLCSPTRLLCCHNMSAAFRRHLPLSFGLGNG
jgi:hypothetical protein